MAFIYAIRNKINGKMYIGKTEYSNPEKRFKRHIIDSRKERYQHRAIYRALNKYGVQNFDFLILEEVSSKDACKREQEYIEQYNTYHSGYNETIGGDGAPYVCVDENKILQLYNDGYSIKSITAMLNHDKASISKILKEHDIPIRRIYGAKPVVQIDIHTNRVLNIYSSAQEAERACPTGKHINQACKGSYQTAGGYKWEYYDPQKHHT